MKKMFALIMAVLMVSFLSTAFSPDKRVCVDNDIGYSLTINHDITVSTIVPIECPVLSGEMMNYQIARGVSVPLKGPNQEFISILNIKYNQYQEESLIYYDSNQLGNFLTLMQNTNQLRGANTRLDIGETLFST
jgi:hypothetical protein